MAKLEDNRLNSARRGNEIGDPRYVPIRLIFALQARNRNREARTYNRQVDRVFRSNIINAEADSGLQRVRANYNDNFR